MSPAQRLGLPKRHPRFDPHAAADALQSNRTTLMTN